MIAFFMARVARPLVRALMLFVNEGFLIPYFIMILSFEKSERLAAFIAVYRIAISVRLGYYGYNTICYPITNLAKIM